MPFTDDEWIEKYSPIEAEKLHALGLITFMWNACEYKLFELFHLLLGVSPQFAWLFVHDLGDVSISNRITAFLEHAFDDPKSIEKEAEVIKCALKAYDACRQNRNQFTHFTMEHDLEAKKVNLLRQHKGATLKRTPFPTDLSDMRRVAIELVGMNNHLNDINKHIRTRGLDQPEPLPGRVAPPELLSKPLPEDHQEPAHQRPPSVLRLTEEEWRAKYQKEGKPLPG